MKKSDILKKKIEDRGYKNVNVEWHTKGELENGCNFAYIAGVDEKQEAMMPDFLGWNFEMAEKTIENIYPIKIKCE